MNHPETNCLTLEYEFAGFVTNGSTLVMPMLNSLYHILLHPVPPQNDFTSVCWGSSRSPMIWFNTMPQYDQENKTSEKYQLRIWANHLIQV